MSIDKSLFSVDERNGEYVVYFRIEGEVRVILTAASKEDAAAQARKMLDGDDFGTELDEVTDAAVSYVRKSPPMYRVTREGKKMRVSVLAEGDIPREPDERGF